MAAFVTFEDVSKVYHSGEIEIRAVDHISFTIEKGEFCVIVGPSGAGKTTVLNMLGGMDACSGGTITVDGTRVSGFNARQLTTYRRHDIGFVFQFYNLVGNLTALENVELAAQICKDPLDAATVLNEVGLCRAREQLPRSALRRRAAARRHRPRAGEESEAPALRRADRRARLCDRQADPEALAGHLPAKGRDGRGHHAQQRHHADGRPRDPHQKRHGGEHAAAMSIPTSVES